MTLPPLRRLAMRARRRDPVLAVHDTCWWRGLPRLGSCGRSLHERADLSVADSSRPFASSPRRAWPTSRTSPDELRQVTAIRGGATSPSVLISGVRSATLGHAHCLARSPRRHLSPRRLPRLPLRARRRLPPPPHPPRGSSTTTRRSPPRAAPRSTSREAGGSRMGPIASSSRIPTGSCARPWRRSKRA